MNAPIRKAFVLGAGLGTRLRALTARRPKPLIPICNKPLITFAFDHLIRNGIERIVVNTHHCHENFAETFPERTYRGLPVHFEHEPNLLETAGGIKNVEPHLRGQTFLVYNGDILSDLPIEKAVRAHYERRNEVTLILRSFGGPLHVALDESTGQIVDIANRLRNGTPARYMFTGIYVVNPTFLLKIPSRSKISVIPIFLHMIQRGQGLGGVVIDEGEWWDLGTREKYLEAHRHFADPHFTFRAERGPHDNWPQWIHPSARIASSARLAGATAVGANAFVSRDAELIDCVLWERAVVAPGSVLRNCVVTAGQTVSGTHTDLDF